MIIPLKIHNEANNRGRWKLLIEKQLKSSVKKSFQVSKADDG